MDLDMEVPTMPAPSSQSSDEPETVEADAKAVAAYVTLMKMDSHQALIPTLPCQPKSFLG